MIIIKGLVIQGRRFMKRRGRIRGDCEVGRNEIDCD